MPDIRLADISEYQPNIDAPAYLGGGYTCLIARAHNGYRPDNTWPGRRDYLRNYAFTALGWYQYLAQDRDAATQAREFCDTVGPLRGNEFLVLDHEEGAGNQVARANAWFDYVDGWQGFPATLYAGESFGNSNLGGWSNWEGRPRWIAAYRSTEPTEPHDLWQNTSSASFPGLSGGVDGNTFHGTDEQFLSRMRPGAAAGGGGTPTGKVGDMVASGSDANGGPHVFWVGSNRHQIFYKYQQGNDWKGGSLFAQLSENVTGLSCAVTNGDVFTVTARCDDGNVYYTWQKRGQTAWNGGGAGKIAGFVRFN